MSDTHVLERLQDGITGAVTGTLRPQAALDERWRSLPARVRRLPVRSRVILSNRISSTHTVIEINGRDFPGLLHRLTRTLADLGLQIQTATVSTYGERVVDVFYVKDLFGLQFITGPSRYDPRPAPRCVRTGRRGRRMSGPPLARAFRQISGLTGLSRILGFGRDVVFAAFLGAGLAADAFVVALKLPNMFRRLTAEGAMANAFVPAYASMREAGGDRAATSLAGEVQTTLFVALCGLVVLGEIFMPEIISVLAPGFVDTPDRMDAAIALARVTFPYLPLISLAAFWAALANAHGRFMVAAALPLIFNICMIGGALVIPMASGWLAAERAMPIAAALLIAGALQLAAMGLLLRRRKLMPRWRLPRLGGASRAMWRTFGVASAGGVVMQVNLVIDLVLASRFRSAPSPGSISPTGWRSCRSAFSASRWARRCCRGCRRSSAPPTMTARGRRWRRRSCSRRFW